MADTYTLYLRLEHSSAAYDLEITLPSYVYHRLGLDTEKRIIVELRRQVVHVIPRQNDAAHSSSLLPVPIASVLTEAPCKERLWS